MIPEDLQYTRGHLWVRRNGETATLGLTEPMVRRLAPLITVELPDPDDDVMVEIAFGEVEGHAETHHLYSPVEALVSEVNDELMWNQRKLLTDPYGKGWLIKIKVPEEAQWQELLSAEQYRRLCIEAWGEQFEDE